MTDASTYSHHGGEAHTDNHEAQIEGAVAMVQIHIKADRKVLNLDTVMNFFPADNALGMELWTADGDYVMLIFDAEETARLAAYSATRTESAVKVQAQELSSVRSAHDEQIELLDEQRSLLGQPRFSCSRAHRHEHDQEGGAC
jgi:hypothetical protein